MSRLPPVSPPVSSARHLFANLSMPVCAVKNSMRFKTQSILPYSMVLVQFALICGSSGGYSDEVRVQERIQKLLSRNLESVFCLSISKSQGEVRKLDSAWRYLDLEICPGSKIRGEARNLDSGWPAPVLGNW